MQYCNVSLTKPLDIIGPEALKSYISDPNVYSIMLLGPHYKDLFANMNTFCRYRVRGRGGLNSKKLTVFVNMNCHFDTCDCNRMRKYIDLLSCNATEYL